MKKLVALSLSASMMLAAAAPALAWHWSLPSTTVVNTATVIGNDVDSSANTGFNAQSADVITTGSGWGWFGSSDVSGGVSQELITGTALSGGASTIAVNQADCGCLSNGTLSNSAFVFSNDVTSSANTGFNSQTASVITTGGKGTVSGAALQGALTGGAASEGWQIIGIGQ